MYSIGEGASPPILPGSAVTITVEDNEGEESTVIATSDKSLDALYLAVTFYNGRREHWFVPAANAYLMSDAGATVDRLHP